MTVEWPKDGMDDLSEEAKRAYLALDGVLPEILESVMAHAALPTLSEIDDPTDEDLNAAVEPVMFAAIRWLTLTAVQCAYDLEPEGGGLDFEGAKGYVKAAVNLIDPPDEADEDERDSRA